MLPPARLRRQRAVDLPGLGLVIKHAGVHGDIPGGQRLKVWIPAKPLGGDVDEHGCCQAPDAVPLPVGRLVVEEVQPGKGGGNG